MSKQILDGAIYDHDVSVRVAGVSDLIAAEGKYHPNCYKRFLRDKQGSENPCKVRHPYDLAL